MKKTIGSIVGLGSLLIAAQAFAASWTAGVDTMPSGLLNVASCQIANNRILYAGGNNLAGTPSIAWAVVDPTGDVLDSDTAGAADDFPSARTKGRMIKVDGDDKCWYLGGDSGSNTPTDTIFEFDLSAGTWTNISGTVSLQDARFDATVEKIDTNLFIVLGGRIGANSFLDSIEVIDTSAPSTDLLLDSLNNPVVLADAKAEFQFAKDPATSDYYVLGGRDAGGVSETAELVTVDNSLVGDVIPLADLDSAANCAQRTNGVAVPVSITVSSVLYEVAVFGGDDGSNATAATCLYSPSNDVWLRRNALDLPTAATGLKITALSSTDFIFGGGINAGNSVASTYKWVGGATQNFTVDTLLQARDSFRMELMQSTGKAFAIGGKVEVAAPPSTTLLNTVEISP